MKIDVRAISCEVREGEVCRWSVRHDYGTGIDVGIDVEVRSESWVAGANGFWLPVLMGFSYRYKWIRGFGLAVLVVSWVWVAGLVGFGCVFWV